MNSFMNFLFLRGLFVFSVAKATGWLHAEGKLVSGPVLWCFNRIHHVTDPLLTTASSVQRTGLHCRGH